MEGEFEVFLARGAERGLGEEGGAVVERGDGDDEGVQDVAVEEPGLLGRGWEGGVEGAETVMTFVSKGRFEFARSWTYSFAESSERCMQTARNVAHPSNDF